MYIIECYEPILITDFYTKAKMVYDLESSGLKDAPPLLFKKGQVANTKERRMTLQHVVRRILKNVFFKKLASTALERYVIGEVIFETKVELKRNAEKRLNDAQTR